MVRVLLLSCATMLSALLSGVAKVQGAAAAAAAAAAPGVLDPPGKGVQAGAQLP